MNKKLIIVFAAIAAFAAFVVAPAASASPVLTNGGVAVPVGTEIKGNNTGIFLFKASDGYTIECSKVNLAAKVTGNSGTQIQLEAAAGGFTTTGTGPGEDCTANWGPASMTWGKMCFATIAKTDSLSVTGCGGEVLFTTNITESTICKYAASSVTATFLTNSDATLRLTSMLFKKVEGGSLLCPAEITFELDLDLTTSAGGTLFIS